MERIKVPSSKELNKEFRKSKTGTPGAGSVAEAAGRASRWRVGSKRAEARTARLAGEEAECGACCDCVLVRVFGVWRGSVG